ncbi:MAG: hypothetical protein AMJ45_00985 [Syntrophobacter sp. DG_60]|nr:MAG: hypothetical protein AMJ45_00985 [Syntrophobacter sp. DG_60]
MRYQYKREPLNDDEVNKLTNACETFEEKFCCWILLDTGLRVSELAKLTKQNIHLNVFKCTDFYQGRQLDPSA